MKGSIIETINLLSKINCIITPSRQQNKIPNIQTKDNKRTEKTTCTKRILNGTHGTSFLPISQEKTPVDWIKHFNSLPDVS